MLKRNLKCIVVAIAVLSAPAVMATDDAGQIKVVNGSVTIERGGQNLPAVIGGRVLQTDTLRTGAGSSVGVTMLDNTLVSAGPNSVLVIERYAFNSTTHQGQFDAGLRRGTLSMVSRQTIAGCGAGDYPGYCAGCAWHRIPCSGH